MLYYIFKVIRANSNYYVDSVGSRFLLRIFQDEARWMVLKNEGRKNNFKKASRYLVKQVFLKHNIKPYI